VWHAPRMPQMPPMPVPIPIPTQQEDEQMTHLIHQMIHGLLLNPVHANQPLIPPNLEPVVVRATPQQIALATTVSNSEVESSCAICQDNIEAGSEIRTLNRCTHAFHTGCIDTWFRTNVRCPVCRHDIRQ
jgi:hypothetical protein